MNLRSKFLLVLTLVISVILILSFSSIYTLYENSKDRDEKKFLLAEAHEASFFYFNMFRNSTLADSLMDLRMNKINENAASHISIFDSKKNLVFQYHDTALNYRKFKMLDSIRENSPYYFESGEYVSVGLLYHSGENFCYTIVSVNKSHGENQSERLKNILIIVALITILFIGLFSFYYVFIVTEPLVKLSTQMRNFTGDNLNKRVEVIKGNFKTNEIVQVATNLNLMLDKLERSFESHKIFVRHASHELQTPLANMLLQTEYGIDKNLDKNDYLRILKSLKEDELDLISLINTLLQLSQYEQFENQQLNPTRIDEILYNSISFAKKSFPDILINFEYATSPESEDAISVNGHPELLRVAFNNLIKNAYSYSTDKIVNIILETNYDGIIIFIENTGKGLQPDEVDRMFLPFFQGENKKSTKGFGLGLAIIEKIIKIHHAKITYKYKDEKINQFIVFFRKHKKNPGKNREI